MGATLADNSHSHKEYEVVVDGTCPDCGEKNTACAMCGEPLHVCAQVVVEERLPKGYRKIPEFPTYMVNRQCNVKHISTSRLALFSRVSNTGGAMVILRVNDKNFTRAAQELRDSAFKD